MMALKEKTVLITGGSRGVGQAIAVRFAQEGANIVIFTRDIPENIKNVRDQIISMGGRVLIFNIDVRDHLEIKTAIAETTSRFKGIDVLVNNTSASCFTNTMDTSPEQFDLLIGTSVRAAFLLSQSCMPYLKQSSNPHIINISPPLNIDSHWFKNHLAFSIGKYAMSMCTLGMAEEFKQDGIAINSLWPQTTIATQSLKDHFLPKVYAGSRWPTIMADAAYEIVRRSAKKCTGQFFIDESLLREAGIEDFSHYAVDPNAALTQPLFIPLENRMTPIEQDLFLLHTSGKSN